MLFGRSLLCIIVGLFFAGESFGTYGDVREVSGDVFSNMIKGRDGKALRIYADMPRLNREGEVEGRNLSLERPVGDVITGWVVLDWMSGHGGALNWVNREPGYPEDHPQDFSLTGLTRCLDEEDNIHRPVTVCYAEFNWHVRRLGSSVLRLRSMMSRGQGSSETTTTVEGRGFMLQHSTRQASQCSGATRIDKRSTVEEFEIGETWAINYSTEYASGLSFNGIKRSRVNFFNSDRITYGPVHSYDIFSKKLYLGSGYSFTADHYFRGGVYNVVMDDEVFVFNNFGKHLRTLSSLTGFVKRSFGYDQYDYLVTISESNGDLTTINRDPAGRVVSVQSSSGDVTDFSFNTEGMISGIASPGKNTTLEYNNDYLLEKITKPGGRKRHLTYLPGGRLDEDKGEEGDGYNLVDTTPATPNTLISSVDLTSKEGRTSAYTSEPTGYGLKNITVTPSGYQVNKVIEPNLDEEITTSDYHRVVLNQNDPRFGATKRVPSSITETIGGKTKTTEISYALSTSSSDPLAYNSLTTSTETNGVSSVEVFNRITRTKVLTSPEGVVTTVLLNQFEKPISVKIGNDNPVNYTYDSKQRITETKQGNNVLKYLYDSKGNMIRLENLRGEVYLYEYDQNGKNIQKTFPNGKTVHYSYDLAGNLIGVTPPGKPKHEFLFNLMNLPIMYSPPNNTSAGDSSTQYLYNLDQQVVKTIRPDLSEVVYSYDQQTGLLKTIEMQGQTQETDYYPSSSNPSQITSFDAVSTQLSYFGQIGYLTEEVSAGSLNSKVIFDYNNFFKPLYRQIEFNSVMGQPISYHYNFGERLDSVGDLDISYDPISGRKDGTTLDNISEFYTYDQNGQLASYTARYNPPNGSPIILYSYTLVRDDYFRIKEKYETVNGVTNHFCYGYDEVGRLISVTKNGVPISFYAYDGNGNRTSSIINTKAFSATFDSQDRQITWGETAFSYSKNGELTAIEVNPSTITHLEYDSLGRLKKVSLPNADEVTYSLDWRGNRIVKQMNGVSNTHYVYENDLRIAAISNQTGYAEFIYSDSINSPEYMIKSGQKFKIIKDHLGSPIMVVNSLTGLVSQRLEYDEWGLVLLDTNPEFQPFGFAGGILDSHTKLVRFGARDYDPEAGRWTSKDPSLFSGGDSNLYGYVSSDPVNWIDPQGLAKCRYTISTGALSCSSNDGTKTGSARMYSGMGDAINDPTKTSEWPGPVPKGTYTLLKSSKHEMDWFMDPGWLSRLKYRFGEWAGARGEFMLHLRDGASTGCITAKRAENKAKLKVIHDILNGDMGNNTIEVFD